MAAPEACPVLRAVRAYVPAPDLCTGTPYSGDDSWRATR